VFNVLKKIYQTVLKIFAKALKIQKLPQKDYANDLRKTIRSGDREH